MLSVEAVHERLIWVLLAAVVVRLDGAVGGTGSVVVALIVFEYPLKLPAASVARMR